MTFSDVGSGVWGSSVVSSKGLSFMHWNSSRLLELFNVIMQHWGRNMLIFSNLTLINIVFSFEICSSLCLKESGFQQRLCISSWLRDYTDVHTDDYTVCASVYLRLSFGRESTIRRYNIGNIFVTLWNWLSQWSVKNLRGQRHREIRLNEIILNKMTSYSFYGESGLQALWGSFSSRVCFLHDYLNSAALHNRNVVLTALYCMTFIQAL